MEEKPLEETVKVEKKTLVQRTKGYLLKEAWKDVLIVGGMVWFCMNFVFFRAIIPSGSMLPTLQIDSKYFVTIFTTFFGENKGLVHGDIVVFRNEAEFGSDLLVKRVIGLPGDTIEMVDGVVIRNEVPLTEPYVDAFHGEYTYNLASFVVPEGEMFLLGDNRSDSNDARYWREKTISLENVVGEMRVFS